MSWASVPRFADPLLQKGRLVGHRRIHCKIGRKDVSSQTRTRAAIMGSGLRRYSAVAVALACTLAVGSGRVLAQGFGSLGGYGAASSYVTPGMGEGGQMIIPYGGMFEGFMPSRMGGGSALSFRSRPTATIGQSRTPFRLSPLSDGMSGVSGGFGLSRAGGRAMSPLDLRSATGIGSSGGRGGMRPMSRVRGESVMPPSIGYPFRQPPSLVPPSTPGPGMSM
jgi:hypothetical protein